VKIITNGVEISKDFITDELEKIGECLRFYSDCRHYEWDGCKCHGRNIILDRGEEAEKGLSVLDMLKEKLCIKESKEANNGP
jgi:hypothetical protein